MGYRDVKARVIGSIREGTWPPGTLLPGETELARLFGCARVTVNRAMRELADEGILHRRRKVGTVVNALPLRQVKFTIPVIREEIEQTGATYRYVRIAREETVVPTILGTRLNLMPDDPLLYILCMHFADHTPYQVEERWINPKVVPQVVEEDFQLMGPNEWLLREIPFTDAETTYKAVNPSARTAELLETVEASALFMEERHTWLGPQTVTFVRSTFHPGYQLRTKL